MPVLTAYSDKSLKAQLRQANNLSVKYTAIIGEDEVKNGTVTLRDMSTSDQRTVPVNKLTELLTKG
jgi:histidyl-tRNA synthetase